MAKLVSFMMSAISQNVPNATGGTVQQLTGPMIVLRPRHIPSEYSFAITIGINDFDLSKENILRIVLYSPSNDILLDTGNSTLPASPTDSNLPKEFQGAVLSMPIQNIEIATDGVYKLEVFMNNDSLGTQAIPVFRLGTTK